MHLSPLNFDELSPLVTIKKENLPKKSFNSAADYLYELSKDAMLEKILLLSVGYFCVGTELRFLSSGRHLKDKSKTVPDECNSDSPNKISEPLNQEENEDGAKYSKKDSEMWHAKAMHIACTFLP
jgi:hypothetical protein